MSDPGLTVGEVHRTLGALQESVRSGFEQIASQIANFEARYLPREVFELRMQPIERSLESAVTSRRFLITTVLSSAVAIGSLTTVLFSVFGH